MTRSVPRADALACDSGDVALSPSEPFDPENGVEDRVWRDALIGAIPFDLGAVKRAFIIAPHPDDEVLALGATIHLLQHANVKVTIVAITDGEASHPEIASLADLRAAEREEALRILGATPDVIRLQIPDGEVWAAADLAERIAAEGNGASHIFAPLEFDGHPDHDAAGKAARLAANRVGAQIVSFAVWAWHWAKPARLPLERARAIPMTAELNELKRQAIAAFKTQVASFAGQRILFPGMLEHFERNFEIVFV